MNRKTTVDRLHDLATTGKYTATQRLITEVSTLWKHARPSDHAGCLRSMANNFVFGMTLCPHLWVESLLQAPSTCTYDPAVFMPQSRLQVCGGFTVGRIL